MESEFKRMLDYCAALEAHNERDWFHSNHKWYEGAKGDFTDLMELLRFAVAEAAPSIGDDIMYMNVKDWMYRVARDMRFHKNRPPYDPSFRAYISADKKSWLPIGYFVEICPGASCVGTGLWLGSTSEINRIRQYIMENYEELDEICLEGDLEVTGNMLKTVPRGFDSNHPAARWLRYKSWFVMREIEDVELTTFQDFSELCKEQIRRFEPFRGFLLRAARASRGQREVYRDFYSRDDKEY